jgi:hypothetical protein
MSLLVIGVLLWILTVAAFWAVLYAVGEQRRSTHGQ